jgi:ribonucleoside-diphosphate reductase alpha subunit
MTEISTITDSKEWSYVVNGINVDVVNRTLDLLKEYEITTAAKILGYDALHYDNMIISGRLLIWDIRRKCSDTFEGYLEDVSEILEEKYLDFMKTHKTQLNDEIQKNIPNEYDHDYFSANSFISNYFKALPGDIDPCETAGYCAMRAAVQMRMWDGVESVIQCFKELASMRVSPPSPVWYNSCMKKNYLSSCFLTTIADDMTSIQHNAGHVFAQVSKGCGAIGMDLSLLRHSEISGGGKSSGVMNLIQVINSNARYCDQTGHRKGAATLNLSSHHIDLLNFIDVVKKVGERYNRVHDINTSIFYNDIFIQRVKAKAKWTLMCPAKTPWLNDLYGPEFTKEYIRTEELIKQKEDEYFTKLKEFETTKHTLSKEELRKIKRELNRLNVNRIQHEIVDAYTVFKQITDVQMETGMPYLNSCDSINLKSNQINIGKIRCTNLCQEIVLHSGIDREGRECIASCNLTSIPLRMFVREKVNRTLTKSEAIKTAYDFKQLAQTVVNVIGNIENIIDYTKYALDTENKKGDLIFGSIHLTNLRNRPMGIGTQGFAEMLFELDLCIMEDREYVTLLNKCIFACLYFNGIAESVNLAIKRGAYENFKDSPLSLGKLQPDLWREETKLREVNNDHPGREPELSPLSWNQESITLCNGDVVKPEWTDLRRAVVQYGVRHSTLFAMMPTATSSQIGRNTESNEMPVSNLYSRKILAGNFTVCNRYIYNDLQELNLWNQCTYQYLQQHDGSVINFYTFVESNPSEYPDFNKDWSRLKFVCNKYLTMYECSQKYMLKLSADRSIYICNSTSQNIYFPHPSSAVLTACHLYAHGLGLKNLIYYLRQEPPIRPIKFALDTQAVAANKVNSSKSSKETLGEMSVNLLNSVDSVDLSQSEEYPICDPNNKECISCSS